MSLLLAMAWSAIEVVAAAAPSARGESAMGPLRALLPTRVAVGTVGSQRVAPGDCLDALVLEQGDDLLLTIGDPGDSALTAYGYDGNVGRFGVLWSVVCAPHGATLAVRIQSRDGGHAGAAPWFVSRQWGTSADAPTLLGLRLAAAGLQWAAGRDAHARSAAAFASASLLLDAAGERERAALCAIFATRQAELAQARVPAGLLFLRALRATEELGWIRYASVLLNNRALFVLPTDLAEARDRIARSAAVQAPLHDAILAAVVENNRCLIAQRSGELAESRRCFEAVLQRLRRVGSAAAALGAARNNLALVQLAEGDYRGALLGFERAARESAAGGDAGAAAIATANSALCLYQLGQVADAIVRLERERALAHARADAVAEAKSSEYLGAIYLVWGDVATAAAYARDAERHYRGMRRDADLAAVLRLRARIDVAAGRLDDALADVEEGWRRARAADQVQVAANLAATRAFVLLERGERAQAQAAIDAAAAYVRNRFPKSDLVALRTLQLRRLREDGDAAAALVLARELLLAVPEPGLPRTRILVEAYLLDIGSTLEPDSDAAFDRLLAAIADNALAAPDPELAFRLLDTARAPTEATIARRLAGCPRTRDCASETLALAWRSLSLVPRFAAPPDTRQETLRGLLAALSSLQAAGDASAAAPGLRARVRELQAQLRRRIPTQVSRPCATCAPPLPSAPQAEAVYFFGEHASWRWNWDGARWRLASLPAWPSLARALDAYREPERRTAALRALSPLVAGLAAPPAPVLRVLGDPRLAQIPVGALPLESDRIVLDRYAVDVAVATGPARQDDDGRALFVRGGGPLPLPSLQAERAAVEQWARRAKRAWGSAPEVDAQRHLLVHVAAHGERDVGGGTAVLWLGEHPLLGGVAGAGGARTVVLNSCESAALPDFGSAQSSVAAALLAGGTRHVVATLAPVSDGAALAFARTFYSSLDADTGNVAEATRQAQLALRRDPDFSADWSNYTIVSLRDAAPTGD